MKDNRSDVVKNICSQHSCGNACPLKGPCATKSGDTKETFDSRMNKAGEEYIHAHSLHK